MLPDIKEELHHPMGFSSLERRALCPGSYNAEDGLPEIPSEDSKEGDMLHNCCATRSTPESLTMEQKECVDRSTILIDSLIDENEATITKTEEKLTICNGAGKIISYGTPDFYCVNMETKKGVIEDHKFGRIKVEDVENNLQLAAGAVAIWLKYGVFEIRAVVNQPRCGKPSEYTFRDFRSIHNHIQNVITKSMDEHAPRIPGAKQCRYCKARFSCAERQAQSTELVSLTQSITSPEALLALPPETLSDYLDKTKALSDAIDMIKAAVKIKAGDSEDNKCGAYELRTFSGKRNVPDINEAFSRISEDVTADEFRGACSISITKLEDLYGRCLKAKGHNDVTLKQAKLDLQEKLSGLIVKQASNQRLERKG